MKILFAITEAVPFSKTGGMADVMATLPNKLKEKGHDVRVILPYYKSMPSMYIDSLKDVIHYQLELGYKSEYCGIKELDLNGIKYYFVYNDAYYYRKNYYGYTDDSERFGFFSMAVCESMEKIGFIPDIIHVSDWRTAMIPFLLVHKYNKIKSYNNIRKVITINNMSYQGEIEESCLKKIFNIDYNMYSDGTIEHNNKVNFLKAGINYSDRIITVSPTYAKEITSKQFGEGLDYVLRHNSWKINGILNGFSIKDYKHFSYKIEKDQQGKNFLNNKRKNKQNLQKELGLKEDKDTLLIGMVGRFNYQKGTILLLDRFADIMKRNVQLVALGMGENKYETALIDNSKLYPEQVSIHIDFNSTLAQKIYSSVDLFLMPSLFEPCGLAQLIAFSFGAIPLVHETGGLKDTVVPYNKYTKEGTGFSFNDFSSAALLHVLDYAISIYQEEPKDWEELVLKAINLDFGWEKQVEEYIRIYNELINDRNID